MQRVTVTLDEELLAEVDALMRARGYQNRSEAIRDLTRSGLKQVREEVAPEAPCMGRWYMSTIMPLASYPSA